MLESTPRNRHHRVIGQSAVRKRSIVLAGHHTSVSLEGAFWRRLKMIADERNTTIAPMVASIDADRSSNTNLSCAIRLFVLSDLESKIPEGLPSHAAHARALDGAAAASLPPGEPRRDGASP